MRRVTGWNMITGHDGLGEAIDWAQAQPQPGAPSPR